MAPSNRPPKLVHLLIRRYLINDRERTLKISPPPRKKYQAIHGCKVRTDDQHIKKGKKKGKKELF